MGKSKDYIENDPKKDYFPGKDHIPKKDYTEIFRELGLLTNFSARDLTSLVSQVREALLEEARSRLKGRRVTKRRVINYLSYEPETRTEPSAEEVYEEYRALVMQHFLPRLEEPKPINPTLTTSYLNYVTPSKIIKENPRRKKVDY